MKLKKIQQKQPSLLEKLLSKPKKLAELLNPVPLAEIAKIFTKKPKNR